MKNLCTCKFCDKIREKWDAHGSVWGIVIVVAAVVVIASIAVIVSTHFCKCSSCEE